MMPCNIAVPVTSAFRLEPIINPTRVPLSGLCSPIKDPQVRRAQPDPQECRAPQERQGAQAFKVQSDLPDLWVRQVPQGPAELLTTTLPVVVHNLNFRS